MLAIAGDSAAGKTTLTKGLVTALGDDRISSICVDDYHRYDRTERKDLPFTPLHPDCNYLDIMEQHLKLLSEGQPILKPVYNHADGSLDRPVYVKPSEFMVVEGLFPLWSRASRACFDATVFLDPPEEIRRAWKVARDTAKRGYTEEQVLADLDKREPESTAYIRPQRAHADIVVQFSPILSRGETVEDPLSATVLMRPTIPHPDLHPVVGDDVNEAMHLKLLRDDDGKPVDALHVHSYASEEATLKAEEAIWNLMAVPEPLSDQLGMIDGQRDGPLAITQLILLFHLIQARHT
ncbi:MAG: phosphoribulokinase [Actinobacteria bacterium]|nr:phosphoribulokinase [Actinomycetota bacterium]MBW3642728.1 phosphoribulokinase [Actinomycetota bacterium]